MSNYVQGYMLFTLNVIKCTQIQSVKKIYAALFTRKLEGTERAVAIKDYFIVPCKLIGLFNGNILYFL
jgi:hypothetical protein